MPRKKHQSCPLCGQPTTERYRPFCSAACADRDLGHWLTGSYTIPASASPDDESEGLARPHTSDARGDDEPSLE